MNATNFHHECGEDGVSILTFDQPGSSANIFNEETLRELGHLLDELPKLPLFAGLIIRSAKPAIFIAGADLKKLTKLEGEEFEELIQLGQDVFSKVAALPVPTVAAIHGACAGGGLELALACDWRVASDAKATKIGLPETKLGILPAWGGSTRLPRLIGLPKALAAILSGKLFKASSAKRKGIVDAVAPQEYLMRTARKFLARGKRPTPSFSLLHSKPAVAFIRNRARANILKQSRGLYPAPLTALQVACRGLQTSETESLRLERDAVIDLAGRPETKQLIRLFFLTEKARKLRITEERPEKAQQVAVIGAGVMGSGIAYWLSTRGIRVLLQDISDDALATGMKRIEKLYAEAVSRRVLSKTKGARGLDRIVPFRGPAPLARMDLVIEAATEDLAIKQKIFADLSQRAGPETIFATNTSALPLRELAKEFPHPERLVGLHFFNPVHRMQLIEVVQASATSDKTLAKAVGFVQQIGKLPVVVGDQPGFLVNRILMPYLMKAGELFAEGGDPVAIDRAMLDFGMPMGPLRLLDEVGLDVAGHVASTLTAAFPDRMETPEVLTRLIENGLHGRKTGAGFYLYDQRGPRPNPDALRMQTGKRALPDDLGEILAHTMVDEAMACLRDGVTDSEDDLDLAMILGTGFAPFRGGPMAYARSLPEPERPESKPAANNLQPTPTVS